MNALTQAIRSWRAGDPLPALLVAFPHHRLVDRCGVCSFEHSVEDYIRDIRDPAFLDALVLDPRTDEVALAASLRHVLRTRGLAPTAAFLADALTRRPDLATRPSVAAVRSALRSPCVLLKVARFDKDWPVPLARAREVVRAMHGDLLAGVAWPAAYRTAADALPGEPVGGTHVRGTHLNYAFDGSATPGYWDFVGERDLRTDPYALIPPGHLEVVFDSEGGTHVLETGTAIWLYHVEEYFGGTDPDGSPEVEGSSTRHPGAT